MGLRLSSVERTLRLGFEATKYSGSVLVLECLCVFFLLSSAAPSLVLGDNHSEGAQNDKKSSSTGGGERERIVLEGDKAGVQVKRSEKREKGNAGRKKRGDRKRGRKKSSGKAGRVREKSLRLAQGPYSGVVPGKDNPPPGKLPADAPKCLLLWPGFQWLPNGAGIVFLQFNKRAEIQQTKRKRRFELLFSGCRIPIRNNRRRLVTRYFPTVVESVRAQNTRKGVHVTINLKKEALAKHRWVTQKGYEFLYLGFVEGKRKSGEEAGDGGGKHDPQVRPGEGRGE